MCSEHCQLFSKFSLDKVLCVHYNVSKDNKEVSKMEAHSHDTNGTPLKNSREIAAMLKKLPRDERLRVEGIILGVGMRCEKPTEPGTVAGA